VLPLGKAINHGGLTRVADAFRLERVDFQKEHDGAIDFAGQRGTKAWQPWRWVPAEQAMAEARAEGYTLAALTLSERSVDFEAAPWKFPLALLIGEEKHGVAPELEAQCDFSIAIPMYGLVTSLNVVTATALAVNSAVRAYARAHPEFQPVRAASRNFFGLEPVDYNDGG
jgi:tRNA (guanosine-2'-O-)-methyltransferase